MKAAAVILAGGASRRMGSPKALLPIGGETFADRLIGVFQGLCDQIVVVLGHEAERIRAGVKRDATFVFNPDHALGQLTSLQAGLRSIHPETDAVFFTPVDYPAFTRSTVTSLLYAHGSAPITVPRFQTHHGHPVLVSAVLVPEFLALPLEGSARDIVHRHAGHTLYVDVDDPGITRDVDHPEEYQALLRTAS